MKTLVISLVNEHSQSTVYCVAFDVTTRVVRRARRWRQLARRTSTRRCYLLSWNEKTFFVKMWITKLFKMSYLPWQMQRHNALVQSKSFYMLDTPYKSCVSVKYLLGMTREEHSNWPGTRKSPSLASSSFAINWGLLLRECDVTAPAVVVVMELGSDVTSFHCGRLMSWHSSAAIVGRATRHNCRMMSTSFGDGLARRTKS